MGFKTYLRLTAASCMVGPVLVMVSACAPTQATQQRTAVLSPKTSLASFNRAPAPVETLSTSHRAVETRPLLSTQTVSDDAPTTVVLAQLETDVRPTSFSGDTVSSLPDLAPETIAADSRTRYVDGRRIVEAPSFNPFEDSEGLAGTAYLRSSQGEYDRNGEPLPDGAVLDLSVIYAGSSEDPYDVRGFEDAVFLSGELVPSVRYDSRNLECSSRVTDVVYRDDYYSGVSHGIVAGLYMAYPFYRGHRHYGYHYTPYYPGGYYRWRDGRRYRHGRGPIGRAAYRRHYRDRDRDRRYRHGRRGEDYLFSDRHLDDKREGRNRRHDGDDRRRDRRGEGRDLRRDRGPLVSGDRVPRTRDRDGLAGARGGFTDRYEAEPGTRPGTRDLTPGGTRARDGRRRDGARGDGRRREGRDRDVAPRDVARQRASEMRRIPPKNYEPMRDDTPRRTRQRRAQPKRPAPQSVDRATDRAFAGKRAEPRASAPRPAPTRAAPARPAPKRPAPKRAAPKRTEPKRSDTRRSVPKPEPRRSTPRRADRPRKQWDYYPRTTRVDTYTSTRCAKEESLGLFIPRERLDAARFDGLTVVLLSRSGEEIPVYVPPNYIEGFRQASGL